MLLLSAASFLYATRLGKFAIWEDQFRRLALGGDEQDQGGYGTQARFGRRLKRGDVPGP